MIGTNTYVDSEATINLPGLINIVPYPIPQYRRNDDLHEYLKAANNCDVECRCIFDHETSDMYHSGGMVMSNILPGVCRDHVTSLFGLDETVDDLKYIDPNQCKSKVIHLPRIWARTLDPEYYAFNTYDWILPQFTPLEMLTIFSKDIDSDIFRNLHISFQLRNFLRDVQESTIKEVDICKPVGTFGNHCNRKEFINVCALYALLTSRYLDVQDDLGTHYDIYAAQILGDAAALQIFINQKIIRKCIDRMINSPENLNIVRKSKQKIVFYNFLARCELKFENTKAIYKPNVVYENKMISALKNICDREFLRVVVPKDTPKEIITMLKKRTELLHNEDTEKSKVVKPPLSERQKMPHPLYHRPMRRYDNVRDALQACNISIGIY